MPVLGIVLTLIAILLATGAMLVASGHRSRRRAPLVYALTLGAGLLGAALATAHLAGDGGPERLILPLGLPWLGAHLRLDALAAAFLVIVNGGAVLASLFATGYGRDPAEPGRILPFWPAFLAALQLVCLADDAFTFLFAWELMSLLSFALVLVEHEREETRRAAHVYLVMAALGTLALLLAMGLLAGPEGAYAFDSMRARAEPGWIGHLVVLLALLGAGSKAGLVPLHAWLPLAHPVAPAHVSALLSGVMTKVALYGLARILFDLLGEPAWWWGGVLMLVGGGGAVFALAHALVERDIKRLLAWSTVENLSVIATALGLALVFRAHGLDAAAALAATAALLHALNHMVMKTLLFCGSGSVLHGAGTGDLERLGGLVHRLPATGAAMLVGAAAISALPPLNGFASEWLLFQAVLQSPVLPPWLLKLATPAVGALLALAAALAAACFVRLYGIAFLGRPRSPEAATAHEADPLSQAGLLAAAALCLVMGVFPGPIVDLLSGAVKVLAGAALPLQGRTGWLSLQPLADVPNSYDGLVLLTFLLAAGLTVRLAVHRLGGHGLARGQAWDCGWPDPAPTTQYTAASMAQPIRRVLGPVLMDARESVTMPPPLDPTPARLLVTTRDRAWDALYRPVGGLVLALADRLNGLQFLTVRRYLSLMFGALVTLLVVIAAAR